jgi:hypothetical protein
VGHRLGDRSLAEAEDRDPMKPYLGICLILVTLAAIAFGALYSCTRMVDHGVASVRDAFASVLKVQPQITLNQQVVMTQTAPIAELAVVTKEELVTLGFTEHIEIMSYTVPLTEKNMTVQATFRIKAGFDLHQPFRVEVEGATHRVTATMPHAKILSVEQVGNLTYHGEDSVLNRLTDDDREKILNDLQATAHAQAESSGLTTDAEAQVTQRLQELFQHNGETLQATWASPDSPPPQP